MAARKFVLKNERVFSHLLRCSPPSIIRPSVVAYSSKKADEINNEPVPFSSSKAAQFNSEDATFNSGRANKPDFEPYIVRFSLAAFLIYFCFLREENDWDNAIEASLFETIPDMEIIMLRNKCKHASESDPFTEQDRLRLRELEKELKLR